MTSIKLMLNQDRMLNSGKYPLVFQIIHKRKRKLIYTKQQLFIDEFDSANQKLIHSKGEGRLSSRAIKKLNKHLNYERKRLENVINDLEQTKKEYTIQNVCDGYGIHQRSHKLLHYIGELINQKQTLEKEGTAAAYKSTQSSLKKFLGEIDINVNEITPMLVREYQDFLRSSNLTDNTIAFYMRNFRTIYNRLVQDGYRSSNSSPFKKVRTSPAKTMKRALSKKMIQKLALLTFTNEEYPLELSRDLFLFSFYTRGMSFVDIAYLKYSDIKNDAIIYRRQKTGQLLMIGIIDQLKALMDKYYFAEREFVMPILNANIPQPLYHQYRMALGRNIRNLKLIGERLELYITLTTYVARHSWATIAKECGVNMSVISEGLGHTSEHTTQIYLKELDSSVLDKANKLVTGL